MKLCHRAFNYRATMGNIKIYLTESIQNMFQYKSKRKQSAAIVKQKQNQMQSLFIWKSLNKTVN